MTQENDVSIAAEITGSMAQMPGALIPVLHAIQRELGCIPAAVVPVIARGLNLSRADVHGVISFYDFFRTAPAGRQTIYLCRAESCQAMGSQALETHAKSRLGIDFHETTTDGEFTLEPVYCLGNCACSPAIMVNDTLHSRVTPTRFDELVKS